MEVLTSKGWVQSLSSCFILLRLNMSPDHLCKEGPAELEEIEIPFNIVVILPFCYLLSMELTITYIFTFLDLSPVPSIGFINQALTYTTCYFIGIWFVNLIVRGQREYHHQTLPRAETILTNNTHCQKLKLLNWKQFFTSRPQICFQSCSTIEHFPYMEVFTPDICHILPQVSKLHVCIDIIPISDPHQLQRDTQLEEFIQSEIHCRNFINQYLSFLQPSTVFWNVDQGNETTPESIVNKVSLLSTNRENKNIPTLPETVGHNGADLQINQHWFNE